MSSDSEQKDHSTIPIPLYLQPLVSYQDAIADVTEENYAERADFMVHCEFFQQFPNRAIGYFMHILGQRVPEVDTYVKLCQKIFEIDSSEQYRSALLKKAPPIFIRRLYDLGLYQLQEALSSSASGTFYFYKEKPFPIPKNKDESGPFMNGAKFLDDYIKYGCPKDSVQYALKYDDVELLKTFKKLPGEINDLECPTKSFYSKPLSPIAYAARMNSVNCVKHLLTNQKNVNTEEILEAISSGNMELFTLLSSKEQKTSWRYGDSYFEKAAEAYRLNFLNIFDIPEDDMTWYNVCSYCARALIYMADKGYLPTEGEIDSGGPDWNVYVQGEPELARLFVENGSDYLCWNETCECLFLSAYQDGNKEILEAIKKRGGTIKQLKKEEKEMRRAVDRRYRALARGSYW